LITLLKLIAQILRDLVQQIASRHLPDASLASSPMSEALEQVD